MDPCDKIFKKMVISEGRAPTPQIRTMGPIAEKIAVTNKYSETKLFPIEFKNKTLVTIFGRPRCVLNLKKKLGERMIKWWREINGNPKTLAFCWTDRKSRRELMYSLEDYEIKIKFSKVSVAPLLDNYSEHTDEEQELFEKWQSYVELKYDKYLRNYETDMLTFLNEIFDAIRDLYENKEEKYKKYYTNIMNQLGYKVPETFDDTEDTEMEYLFGEEPDPDPFDDREMEYLFGEDAEM